MSSGAAAVFFSNQAIHTRDKMKHKNVKNGLVHS